ncbi:MAG: hypothetical protein DRP09_21070 [Candidatus Thorarchaeota archaeon]|nr:MAG: hypothetical protein DRP09_21070 [Candidatus Thorarchaeota archaeon]
MTKLKPEMHDIGKLIDSSIIKHNFENYPNELKDVPPIKKNPIWEGILQHHCSKDFKEYPKNFKTFVLSIADSVASATSRHIEVKGEPPRYNIYKLWNPPDSNIHELSKVTKEDTSSINWIGKIVEFINKNPSVDEFFEIFGKYLKARTEDATPGSNITSLWTHSKLTALFYNFLYDCLENVSDKWFEIATKDEIGDYIRRVREENKIKIVKIRIILPQRPVRIRDLNIFDVLKEVKKEILKKYPNNVIFVGFNELLLILPLNKKLEEMREIVSKYGFWFEYVERVQNLDQPYPDPDRVMRLINKMQKIQYKKFKEQIAKVPPDKRKKAEEGIRKTIFEKGKEAKRIAELWDEYHHELSEKLYKKSSIYANLPDQINPPICEICQLSRATEKWIDEESGIVENLCKNCLHIRKRGSKFPKLDEWEKEGADRILWIRIGLDINELINVLEDLYAEYLRSLGVREPEERAEIRFSVLSEFDWDYKEFLSKFRDKILDSFEENNFQQILEDFVAVKIKSLKDVFTVLRIFDDIFSEFFPKFKEVTSSIKLGVVCSNIKYPFLESWRILSDLKYDVHVCVIGKGEIRLNMEQLTPFLEIKVKNKALIHKLVAMSEISEKLAEIMLYDRADRDYRKYKPLRDAIRKFGYQNILTYAKIMGG